MAMEETYTLTCKFKDTENKTRTIEVNNEEVFCQNVTFLKV